MSRVGAEHDTGKSRGDKLAVEMMTSLQADEAFPACQ
jgi:hypothetical protein